MEAEVTTIAPTAAHSREDVNAWPTGGKLPGFECGYAHRRRCAVLMHCRVSSRSVRRPAVHGRAIAQSTACVRRRFLGTPSTVEVRRRVLKNGTRTNQYEVAPSAVTGLGREPVVLTMSAAIGCYLMLCVWWPPLQRTLVTAPSNQAPLRVAAAGRASPLQSAAVSQSLTQ